MEEIDPTKALRYIQENAKDYAQAKANRIQIEMYSKSLKAKLMAEEDGTLGAKEIYAYSHHSYVTLIEGLKVAVEQEEYLKYMLEAAKLKIEVWKTQEYSKRAEIRATT